MNSAKVENILSQAASLQKAEQSFFWSKIAMIQKITFTAKKLTESLSTKTLLKFLQGAIRLNNNTESHYLLFGLGLFPKGGYG